MQLNTQDRNVTRSGSFPEAKFKIAANAKAFDILSSKLYTNTCLAIVRELSTNAWDAQVEAGMQDRPFEVRLPNSLAPHFLIRDFGTGLSPDQVENIYTTYFASTRTDSNDFVGALGLGSKSPFSYTDQFTVTSYWNGVAYTYSAFKNEKGEPSIALLSAQNSHEPNGVEVCINVKAEDAYAFHAAAQRVYRFFPVRPRIVGAKVDFPTVEPRFKGDGYALYDCGMTNAALPGRINVVMGNICYPVSSQHFQHKLGDNAALVLFVDIGEVEVAASREELHYSEDTKKNIQARIDAALAEVNKAVEDELGQHICLIEKIKALRHYRSVIQFQYTSQIIPIEVPKEYSLKRVELRSDKLYVGRDRFQTELNPAAETNYVIVENDVTGDLKQGDKNRLRHFLRQQRGVFYLATIQDRAKFEATFGSVSATLSTLPEAPKTARVGYTGPRSYIKAVRIGGSRRSDSWESIVDTDIDVNDAVAVPRKGNSAIINGQEYNGSHALSIAEKLGYKKVYGIAQAYYDRIRNELNLPDLDEEARQFTQEAVDKLDTYQLARMEHKFDHYSTPNEFLAWIEGLSPACDDLVKLSKATELDDVLRCMISLYGISVPKSPNYHTRFKEVYPLLSYVNLQHVKREDVVEYITLKNQSHKEKHNGCL
jgi:hypothetical protein